jgi:galactokinase
VVTEDARVLAAVSALRQRDLPELGRLFVASHHSMRDDFEVSIPEIDRMVEIACGTAGVLGARLTGGGFGGSIVALCDPARLHAAADSILAKARRAGIRPSVLVPRLST